MEIKSRLNLNDQIGGVMDNFKIRFVECLLLLLTVTILLYVGFNVTQTVMSVAFMLLVVGKILDNIILAILADYL